MKKEYLIILSILVGSIIISTATYMGTTYEFRAELKVCEEHYKPYIKKIEKCKKAVKFGNFGN
jgi:hypothetical protein